MTARESIRNKIENIRNLQSKDDVNKNSNIILDKLFSIQIFEKSNCIAFYSSLEKEVYTINMIQQTLTLGKTVCLPKVNQKSHTMNFHIIDGLENLKKNTLGISEPIDGEICTNIDVAIIPGIAFDKSGNRLGFGSGYYDKFLSSHSNSYKIALAFDFQIVDSINSLKHDVPMDLIITENRTIYIK